MDDKLSLLMIDTYYSENAEKWQYRKHRPVKENIDGSSEGLPTHAAGMTIDINPYGYDGNINNTNFYEHLDNANNLFKLQYNKEGDETYHVPKKKSRTEKFTRPPHKQVSQRSPRNAICKRTKKRQASVTKN